MENTDKNYNQDNVDDLECDRDQELDEIRNIGDDDD